MARRVSPSDCRPCPFSEIGRTPQAPFTEEIGPEAFRREVLTGVAAGSALPAIGWLTDLLKWAGLLQVAASAVVGMGLVAFGLAAILIFPRSIARLNQAILARQRRVLVREPDKLGRPENLHMFREPVSQVSKIGSALPAAVLASWAFVPGSIRVLVADPPPVLAPRWSDADWHMEAIRGGGTLRAAGFFLHLLCKTGRCLRPLLRRVPTDG
ncbi:hypothetical protein [Mangrovicoccus sp. HB161399]|uniref:hypothetical protein n=1 Tax=Mangrovicoccus sp. HB161399 TaxID=2720392 RepID=UPI0015559A86|nr:hypothetical protein [Mangrovicoccus sp. HB161399]